MRISTSAMHTSALATMMTQQSQLTTTQNQIALGRRVNTPADDPVASVHIMELERSLRETEQYDTNSNMATNRLSMEESSLASVGSLLHRVQELTVQANSSTVHAASRKMLATEVRARVSELMDIANQRDANGEYLFSGYATKTQPFSQSGSTTTYSGDQGARLLQVGPNQKVADSHSGYDVFMNVPQGNGTFVTDVGATNTGNAAITVGTVTNPAQWVPDDYTLRFTSATGDYEILDSAAAVVTTGTYAQNGSIAFNGVSVTLSGTPASGDTFSIARSRSEDLFTTLNDLVATLESGPTSASDQAAFSTAMGRTLQQLDQSSNHLLGVRAEVGARLSVLENADSAREGQKVELQRMTSDLRDLDYAEAITRMNQQLMGLQAAQASYSKISQLSLFDYLR